jgi:inosine-uridine nucleoside N-ribohydrolase
MNKRLGPLVAAALLGLAVPAMAAEKIIFDTDFNTMGDDGQAFVNLSQMVREGRIELLGLTTVSGNQWVDQENADALRAVERMGMAGKVGVHPGSVYPLIHDQAGLAAEQTLFGKGYSGAWKQPRPAADKLVAPPDGFASHTRLDPEDAVDFIVDTIRKSPHEVTILATGPLTNLALAFRKNPEIVPLVKRIVYMGGAVEVPGNVTPAAEFNWWFDPEAAKIVLRLPIPGVVIPLDVTDKTRFGKAIYDKVSGSGTPIGALFKAEYADTFAGGDPDARAEVWDTIATAVMLDPSLVTESKELWIDVDTVLGPDYGRALGYAKNPPVRTHKAEVVQGIDQQRFWKFYTDLLTRPVKAD